MRGKQASKRDFVKDVKYGSVEVSKFVNYIMYDGRKKVAQKVVYDAIDMLSENTKTKPLEAFEIAIANVKPKMEVRSRRVGGANYQVPVPVREERQLALAYRWIIDASRASRKNTSYAETLALELTAAFNNEGIALDQAELNKFIKCCFSINS